MDERAGQKTRREAEERATWEPIPPIQRRGGAQATQARAWPMLVVTAVLSALLGAALALAALAWVNDGELQFRTQDEAAAETVETMETVETGERVDSADGAGSVDVTSTRRAPTATPTPRPAADDDLAARPTATLRIGR